MNVLVTGANGFVGTELVARLGSEGHAITGTIGPGKDLPLDACKQIPLDLTAPNPLGAIDLSTIDAVVHLAAISSSTDARRDPGLAWTINVTGTVRILEAFGDVVRTGQADPVFLLVSSCDVYRPVGGGELLDEAAVAEPGNSYAASKLAAEIAAREVARRTGLRLVIARPFPHTGSGQDTRFVAPDFARKILLAKRDNRDFVDVGNLDVVRELLHVRDVVDAYTRLLSLGEANEIYNVAGSRGYDLRTVFDMICELAEYHGHPRSSDPDGKKTSVVGDGNKLTQRTGWVPEIDLAETLGEVVAAQVAQLDLD